MRPAAQPEGSRILAISGSLRRNSINSAALRAAAAAAARDGLAVVIDDSPRVLPPFDPDREPFPPEAVRSGVRAEPAVLRAAEDRHQAVSPVRRAAA